MNVFEAVRDSVTARQAAESYGIKVNRNGMACCPFHDDKHPSMKLSKRYHCFGCQADGDAISFVSRYFDLRLIEAAKKLADDFGISYDEKKYNPSNVRAKPNPKIPAELEAKKKEMQCYRTLCDYLHLLQKWRTDYAPETPDAEYHPLFVEALQKISYVEYVLDEVFLNGSAVDKAEFIRGNGDKLSALEKRIQDMIAIKGIFEDKKKSVDSIAI